MAKWPDLEYRNFTALLDDIEQKWGEKIAIRFRTGKQIEFTRWTYADFAGECRRIARGLIKAGLKKGDRVALWAGNRPEWMVVWMGSLLAGCSIVPIDYLVSDKECTNIIEITKARAFFYSSRKEEFVQAHNIEVKLCIDGEGAAAEAYREFGKDTGVSLPPADSIDPNDPASIVFTSGTTGFAKGVTLSHRNIIANVNAALLSIQPRRTDTFINVLPLHHTYPTTCSFLTPLVHGTGLIIVEKLVGKVVIDDIRDADGRLLIAVPLLYDKVKDAIEAGLKKLPLPVRGIINVLRSISLALAKKSRVGFGQITLKFVRKKTGLASIRTMVAGGGPLSPQTADFFESLGFNIIQGYGMSENAPLISVGTPGYKNNYSVGLPVKYTEIKIFDPNEEGIGEIAARSPSVMLGYYNNPEATKEVITNDGWLLTGDLGYQDKKGFIFITGRKKNLIVSSGGKNIYPEEIEQYFGGCSIITEILVLGRKDQTGGEHVVAVIVPNREALSKTHPQISAEGAISKEGDALVHSLIKEEIEQVNRKLPGYKKIADFDIRYEEFEKNAQQKIRRFLYRNFEKAPRSGDRAS